MTGVKVVVSGGTGVIGRAAVRAMADAGHSVDVVTRRPDNVPLVESLGATPLPGDVFEAASLAPLFRGADAVVNLATHVPVGYAAALGHSWRRNDRLRTRAVPSIVAAAREAGVRRVVQESISFVYADHGDAWITEDSPIEITSVTEPVAVAEAAVQDYACESRIGVLLRFGLIVGDDDQTRFWLRAAAHGRPVGIGRPETWTSLLHTDDLGGAVLAALHAPSGVYNVGAEPVRRSEVVEGYAKAAGADSAGFLGPVLRRFAGPRLEPLTRSLRISSERFSASTGWRPLRAAFDPAWFDAALEPAPPVGS
jgi:nucleoside-diphosphate-sugar epimerase